MNKRLAHDAAVAVAKACLDVVESCVHPSCHKDAWEEFYTATLAGIEAYCLEDEMMKRRMNPVAHRDCENPTRGQTDE